MLDFLQKQLKKKADAASVAREEFDRLLRQAGEGDLGDRDGQRLVELAEQLAITPEAGDTDVRALRRAKELQAEASQRGELSRLAIAAAKVVAEFDAETDRQVAARRADRTKLYADQLAASANSSKAYDAMAALRKLKQDHWQLFGGPDPSVEAKKVHLAHLPAGVEVPAGPLPYKFLDIAYVLNIPEGYRPADELIFVKMLDQSEEDLAELVDLYRSADQLRRTQLHYLSHAADKLPPVNQRGRIDAVTVEAFNQSHRNPGNVRWIRRPGQSREAFAQCVADVHAAFKAYEESLLVPNRLGQ